MSYKLYSHLSAAHINKEAQKFFNPHRVLLTHSQAVHQYLSQLRSPLLKNSRPEAEGLYNGPAHSDMCCTIVECAKIDGKGAGLAQGIIVKSGGLEGRR